MASDCVVYNHIKDTKFHQFTTHQLGSVCILTLSIITSKIQNFINSQPLLYDCAAVVVVYNHIKDTKFHQFTTTTA